MRSNLLPCPKQEQRPGGNGDREAIVVGAGLCGVEGERACTAYAPRLRGIRSNEIDLREGATLRSK